MYIINYKTVLFPYLQKYDIVGEYDADILKRIMYIMSNELLERILINYVVMGVPYTLIDIDNKCVFVNRRKVTICIFVYNKLQIVTFRLFTKVRYCRRV